MSSVGRAPRDRAASPASGVAAAASAIGDHQGDGGTLLAQRVRDAVMRCMSDHAVAAVPEQNGLTETGRPIVVNRDRAAPDRKSHEAQRLTVDSFNWCVRWQQAACRGQNKDREPRSRSRRAGVRRYLAARQSDRVFADVLMDTQTGHSDVAWEALKPGEKTQPIHRWMRWLARNRIARTLRSATAANASTGGLPLQTTCG